MQQTPQRADDGLPVVDEEKIRQIFADVFKIPVADVSSEMTPDNVDAWDSFGHMQLITAVETRLGVRLTMDQVMAIDSYAAFCEVLQTPSNDE